jgi:alpha-beta hydrolase superfamily lysophospholipase
MPFPYLQPGMSPLTRRLRRLALTLLIAYLAFCVFAAITVSNAALHPPRRPVTDLDETFAREGAARLPAQLTNATITTADGLTLRAWLIHPENSDGSAVLLLHGVADSRLGVTGQAELLLRHGYTVLMPDSRAHGTSDGLVATYGLLERDDIHRWVVWLRASEHPRCVFGLGESMGAAQLLQSLSAENGFCAVVAESPFATFREIAYDRMGQYFGIGPWLGRTLLRPVVELSFLYARLRYSLDMQQISPEDAASASNVPILLVHGTLDGNIPLRHCQRILARTAPRTVLWEVPGADHTASLGVAPEEFERRVISWFAAHDASPASRHRHLPVVFFRAAHLASSIRQPGTRIDAGSCQRVNTRSRGVRLRRNNASLFFLFIPSAGQDRQPRILRKARVAQRPLAQKEDRSAIRFHSPRIETGRTQTRGRDLYPWLHPASLAEVGRLKSRLPLPQAQRTIHLDQQSQ